MDEGEWQGYKQRLERHFSRLFALRKTFTDTVTDRTITAAQQLVLDAYQPMVLVWAR